MNTLAIIPTYIRDERDFLVTVTCLRSLSHTAVCDVAVIDDCSPAEEFRDKLYNECRSLGFDHTQLGKNRGTTSAVNVGLKSAKDTGRNAVVVHADIEFEDEGWLEKFEAHEEAVVGALLVYPFDLVQHAGIFFSIITRQFDHIYKFAPPNLNEVNKPRVCPVSSALMFIRNSTLRDVGLFDPNFKLLYEDIDYCHTVSKAGKKVVFDPEIRAVHHEGFFRTEDEDSEHFKWQEESFAWLHMKHAGLDFSEAVPTLMPELDEELA